MIRQLDWTDQAACRLHIDWTPDARPTREDEAKMTRICDSCPVMRRCAQHAVESKAEGGYYAGVWVPAAVSNGGVSSGWLRAREQLKRIATTGRISR